MSDNDKNTELPADDVNDIKEPETEENRPTEDSELHGILYGSEYSGYEGDLGGQEPEKTKYTAFRRKKEEKPDGGKKRKTMTQKQITLISVIAAVIVATVALVLIFAPELFKGGNVEVPVKVYDGEVLASSTRVLIYEHVERENIQRIEVHNEYGTYVVYYSKEEEAFLFEGMENAPYDEDLFSQLVVASGYTLIADRFTNEDNDKDGKPDRAELSEYGLGENDNPAYYILTTRDGKTHKMYIGKPSLTENYYYCMYEGRDIVYILEQSISTTLLADVKTMITPLMTYPIEDNSYLTDISLIIIDKKDEEPIIIQSLDEEANKETQEALGVTVPYIVVSPLEYDASTTKMTTLLGQIVNMTGTKMLEVAIYDVELKYNEDGTPLLDENGNQEYDYVMKPEIAEKYGFDNPYCDIYYRYQDMDMMVSVSEKMKDEDGTEYYCIASLLFDTVARIDAATLTFVDWELMDYLDKPIFSVNIDKVSKIEIDAGEKHFRFTLTGTADGLVAVEDLYGKRTVFKGEDPATAPNTGIRNFRKFYQTILSINREDFAEEPDEQQRALLVEMKVTFRSGDVKVYRFYSYSERRCFLTINDKGEFYVMRSMVEKLVNDAVKLMNFIAVDPNATE